MESPTTDIKENEARAAAYRLLSEAFHEPTPRCVDEKEWGEIMTVLPKKLRVTVPPRPNDPAREFRRVFGHNLSPDCPPYETHYGQLGVFRKTQELADLAGFYRAFGLETAEGDRRPDHLPVELEFLSLLCRKEALALERGLSDKAALCRGARKRFLGDHLGRWADAFAQAVGDKAPGGYFAQLSCVLAAFVRAEAENLGADTTAPRPRQTMEEPEDICASCFGGVDETT